MKTTLNYKRHDMDQIKPIFFTILLRDNIVCYFDHFWNKRIAKKKTFQYKIQVILRKKLKFPIKIKFYSILDQLNINLSDVRNYKKFAKSGFNLCKTIMRKAPVAFVNLLKPCILSP